MRKRARSAPWSADYEDQIRDHALGKFRDLLLATVVHPAMLQYLDNAQNAAGHINENYAREIMELHTLGVGSGYSQQDVQELARILTGLTVNLSGRMPGGWWRGDFRSDFPDDNRHVPLTVFNPQRHDFGEKHFLGTTIKGRGIDEIATAIAILSVEPPTAHYVSKQLAQYFCCDQPSEALVHAMTATWRTHRRRHRRSAAYPVRVRRNSPSRWARSSRTRSIMPCRRCAPPTATR